MSRFTNEELDRMTLIGMTDELGKAWHGAGHFAGAVPVDEAVKFLTLEVDTHPIYVIDVDAPLGFRQLEGFQAVIREDTSTTFQVTSDGWVKHDYVKWLIDNVVTLVDASEGELMIGSVLLLGKGEQACVQVRPPVGVEVGGDLILPWLAAYSSMDSSLATGYKAVRTRIVCDNTMAGSLYEKGGALFKVKHTKNSQLRVAEAREAVGLIFKMAEDSVAEIDQLQNTTFTEADFTKLKFQMVPVPTDDGPSKSIAEKKHFQISHLWNYDTRVQPYKGTAWGAFQAFSCYTQHFQTVRGTDRVSRNAKNLIAGKTAETDSKVLDAIHQILQPA